MATLKYPERLLQPFKSLKQFQQELYAMHKEGESADSPQPLAITEYDNEEQLAYKGAFNAALAGHSREDARQVGLDLSAIRRPEYRDRDSSPAPPNGTAAPRPRAEITRERVETKAVADRRREAGQPPSLPPARNRPDAPGPKDPEPPARTPRPEPSRPKKDKPPAQEETRKPRPPGEPAPPRPPDPPRKKGDLLDYRQNDLISPRLPYVGGGGGGTTVFLGKVVSGSGDTYQVTLYPNGPKASPDDTPVEVTVPQIVHTEKIPADTWLSAIYQFPAPPDEFGAPGVGSVYSCQPPVWMP